MQISYLHHVSQFGFSVGVRSLVDGASCSYNSFQGTNMGCILLGRMPYSDYNVLKLLALFSQVFTFSQKISVNFQLLLRFIQGLTFLMALAGLVVAIIITPLSVPDVFACILAFVPTGWGILCVSFLLLFCFTFTISIL